MERKKGGQTESPTAPYFLLREQAPASVSPLSQRVWKMPIPDSPCLSPLKSTCHICLLSAFISQRASDSFGKLKAHVFSCWGISHYCAIYRPSAAPEHTVGSEGAAGELVWVLGAAWFGAFAASLVSGNDVLVSLLWALLSLPSLSPNWPSPS